MTAPVLAAQRLEAGYGQNPVITGLDFTVPPGRITAIVGANACGKSTLLRSLSRLLRPAEGAVTLDGTAIRSMSTRALARRLGLLPQSPVAPDGITVADLVSHGRYPHHGPLSRWSAADDQAVARALDATRTAELADRDIDALSGGQRQRVWIAMALAQDTDLLLLDEPTTFLDVAHQIEVLDLLEDLNRDRGTTIVMVLHDLNMAARYADHLVAMHAGAIAAAGAPETVLTEAVVERVFGLRARIMADPVTGKPMMLPLGRHARGTPHPQGKADQT
ncbi:iron dicitrate ABC transporter ATP-binding protein [Oceanicola sp. 22II-s10i]|uniref:ABC transporter ATP-binding protein n=1 Tax=Oceanicola sp. 22II-s10i TaxID=1317116 RepID=UPI000B5274E8|nr:ABC transporter ATP-binding protein [Oceanicola sp. 22II-s10i]OWU84205.1 iron dicitrate ABC transporter ATP-binding protein [Oceanicola sp. 22II-s10i]